jgi:hypothetical protein
MTNAHVGEPTPRWCSTPPRGNLATDDRSRSRSEPLAAPRGNEQWVARHDLLCREPVAGQRSERIVLREACFKALLHRRVSGAQLAVKPDRAPRPSMGFGPPSRCAPRHSLCGRRAAAPPKRCPVSSAEAWLARETYLPYCDGSASTIPLVLTGPCPPKRARRRGPESVRGRSG